MQLCRHQTAAWHSSCSRVSLVCSALWRIFDESSTRYLLSGKLKHRPAVDVNRPFQEISPGGSLSAKTSLLKTEKRALARSSREALKPCLNLSASGWHFSRGVLSDSDSRNQVSPSSADGVFTAAHGVRSREAGGFRSTDVLISSSLSELSCRKDGRRRADDQQRRPGNGSPLLR